MKVNIHGVSIIEALAAMGIFAIISSAMISLQIIQQRETKGLSEKLALLDAERLFMTSLVDGSSCLHILKNPVALTFDSQNLPQYITPTLPLYSKVVAGVPGPILAQVGVPLNQGTPTVVVKSIKMKIISGSAGTYSANWEISLDPTLLVRALKPITVSALLTADDTIPASAKITGCMESTGGNVTLYRTRGNIGKHKFCALNVVQNGWNTSIGNNQIGVYRNPDGTWNLNGACDTPRCGAVCMD